MSFPGDLDLIWYQGDRDLLRYQLLHDDGTPMDLTGGSVTITAKHNRRDVDPVFVLEAYIPAPATGDFEFAIEPDLTRKLGLSDAPIFLVYDMACRTITEDFTVVFGRISITPEVTR